MKMDSFLQQHGADAVLDLITLELVQISESITGHHHPCHVGPQGYRVRSEPILIGVRFSHTVAGPGQCGDGKRAVRLHAKQLESEVIGAWCFSAKMAASGKDHFQ